MIRMLPSLFARGYIRNSTEVPHLPWISQLLLSLWTWHGARNTMPGSLWPTGDHCGSHCWPTRMQKSLILWGFPRANVGKRLSALGLEYLGWKRCLQALAAGWWDHEHRLHFSSFSLKINPAKLVQNTCRDHLHWGSLVSSHKKSHPHQTTVQFPCPPCLAMFASGHTLPVGPSKSILRKSLGSLTPGTFKVTDSLISLILMPAYLPDLVKVLISKTQFNPSCQW